MHRKRKVFSIPKHDIFLILHCDVVPIEIAGCRCHLELFQIGIHIFKDVDISICPVIIFDVPTWPRER